MIKSLTDNVKISFDFYERFLDYVRLDKHKYLYNKYGFNIKIINYLDLNVGKCEIVGYTNKDLIHFKYENEVYQIIYLDTDSYIYIKTFLNNHVFTTGYYNMYLCNINWSLCYTFY